MGFSLQGLGETPSLEHSSGKKVGLNVQGSEVRAGLDTQGSEETGRTLYGPFPSQFFAGLSSSAQLLHVSVSPGTTLHVFLTTSLEVFLPDSEAFYIKHVWLLCLRNLVHPLL